MLISCSGGCLIDHTLNYQKPLRDGAWRWIM
jgi:hypothetical protein